MEQAFSPGAETWLKGNGGLRAQILSDGFIEIGDARLVFVRGENSPARSEA
jgi:hypothetical protein